MFVKPFGYERAGTLAEASQILRAYGGGARPIAGGQSLLPMINLGLVDLRAVVDISRIEEASRVAEEDGHLRIGALVRHAVLERDPTVRGRQPLLSAAAASVGNGRVRAVGTLGGSLAHADPAAELPLVLTALDAEYTATDGGSTRTIRADELAVTYFTTQLDETELLTSIRVPALGRGWGWGFAEVSRRRGDFAIAAAAVLARWADGLVVESRVAVAGLGDRPLRLAAVEASIDGAPADGLDARVREIEGVEPISDSVASAAYRRRLARVLIVRALVDACRRSEEAA
jgi:aerobic carbon-monoxide dehydrogenase medium subunit